MNKTMLDPDECFAASLQHAAPMSFIIPTASYTHRVLVVSSEGQSYALFVDGPPDFRFHFLECADRWAGLHVPDVRIELDPASIVFTDGQWPPLGSLTRHGENLNVQTSRLDRRSGGFSVAMTIMSGLPTGDGHEKACFSRWQIVVGEGDKKRVLHEVQADIPEAL
ncbi:hypothetical protein CVO77_17210 [Sphingopyxis lindanitolerans]|uniref:Uncharacterized protein n=1 Tax=Sphingopyxis lindanitolerans TaxID=2054227 RepID=A0A2S8B324_9SPHN|nr:hypothetical protein [Sphingopyxis lindanitolerans]PQM26740.1 hypothetical protein CVO77_17210 [Sphingopyxis lindanitolerans]